MSSIKYKSGYKYQLVEATSVLLQFNVPDVIIPGFITIKNQVLYVKEYYAWDGPSGPTFDTKDFMRASLFHDALSQLMREGHLDSNVYRFHADQLLKSICLEDGMPSLRARYVYAAVRAFGAKYAEKQPIVVEVAP